MPKPRHRWSSSLQEVNHRGRKTKHGIKLWLVGVGNAKDLLLLAIIEAGPDYVHTSTDLTSAVRAMKCWIATTML